MTLQELAKHTPKSKAVEDFFFKNAGYAEDSPSKPYVIRVGAKTFFSDDTMDLRIQLELAVARERRRQVK